MKRPRRHPGSGFPSDARRRMCTRKRRYRTQADALDAALIAGVARERKAYQCPLCGHWHLSSVDGG